LEISGSTKIFPILADPIAHVRVPQVFNARIAAAGIDAVVVPFQVSAEDLPALWPGLKALKSLGGIVVTVPHKPAIPNLCDEASVEARQVGSANVVRREPDGRMVCTMFDGVGFVAGLQAEGHDLSGKAILQAGAGGAGSAVAFALAAAGPARLAITNRTMGKAEALAEKIAAAYPGLAVEAAGPDPSGFDLVVNTTSLGMKEGDAYPVTVENLSPGMLVAEVIMKPEMTPLLTAAQTKGCGVHLGRHMLEQQVKLLFAFLGLSTEP